MTPSIVAHRSKPAGTRGLATTQLQFPTAVWSDPLEEVVTLRLSGVMTNACTVTVQAEAGQRLELQSSVDLTNWTAFLTFTNLNQRTDLSVSLSNAPVIRFFRALRVP